MTEGLFTVLVDDHFHYHDEADRWTFGTFRTLGEAESACRSIVDASLSASFRPGMSADELFELYGQFGDDPFIRAAPGHETDLSFSSWDYARRQAEALCSTNPSLDRGRHTAAG